MGGSIGLVSDAGMGSTFWIELPFEKQAIATRAEAVPGQIQGARVLVVDDNSTNRRILCAQLRSWNCEPVEAIGGQQALDLLSGQADFALILMDLQMPGMDGETATAMLKADAATAAIPVVLLSSSGAMKPEDLRAKGFAAALTKPVRQSQLYNCIVDAFQHRSTPAKLSAPPRAAAKEVVLGLHVLVAEDNAINQKVARRMLERWQCEVVGVEDGQAAIRAAEEREYDLVLMDCHMPLKNGYEATAAIRVQEKQTGRRVPIIAMTANALEGDRERCLAAGMDDYVSKPVRPDDLLEAIYRQKISAGAAA